MSSCAACSSYGCAGSWSYSRSRALGLCQPPTASAGSLIIPPGGEFAGRFRAVTFAVIKSAHLLDTFSSQFPLVQDFRGALSAALAADPASSAESPLKPVREHSAGESSLARMELN